METWLQLSRFLRSRYSKTKRGGTETIAALSRYTAKQLVKELALAIRDVAVYNGQAMQSCSSESKIQSLKKDH